MPIFYGHDIDQPTGFAKVFETADALRFTGRLDRDLPSGAKAHAYVKSALGHSYPPGISVGFAPYADGVISIPDPGSDVYNPNNPPHSKNRIRAFKSAALREINVVPFEASPGSQVLSLKRFKEQSISEEEALQRLRQSMAVPVTDKDLERAYQNLMKSLTDLSISLKQEYERPLSFDAVYEQTRQKSAAKQRTPHEYCAVPGVLTDCPAMSIYKGSVAHKKTGLHNRRPIMDDEFNFYWHLSGNEDMAFHRDPDVSQICTAGALRNAISAIRSSPLSLSRKTQLISRALQDWSSLTLDLITARIVLEQEETQKGQTRI